MTRPDLAVIVLALALSCTAGYWMGQAPVRFLKSDNLKCEFIFPPIPQGDLTP